MFPVGRGTTVPHAVPNVSGGTRNDCTARSPKCFRWDEERLYRSPKGSFKGLVEAVFGHTFRFTPLWYKEIPTDWSFTLYEKSKNKYFV